MALPPGAARTYAQIQPLSEASMNNMMGSGMRRGRSLRSQAGALMREHPVTMALLGVGVGWLVYSLGSPERRARLADVPRRVRRDAHDAGAQARHAAEGVYDRASTSVRQAAEYLSDRVQGSAAHDTSQVRQRVAAGAREATHYVEEHPLLGGAVSLAAGILLAAVLPSTRTEDVWMGEAADKAYDRLKSGAEDAVDRGLGAVAGAGAATEDTARR